MVKLTISLDVWVMAMVKVKYGIRYIKIGTEVGDVAQW
jgi:hypothetical protein